MNLIGKILCLFFLLWRLLHGVNYGVSPLKCHFELTEYRQAVSSSMLNLSNIVMSEWLYKLATHII